MKKIYTHDAVTKPFLWNRLVDKAWGPENAKRISHIFLSSHTRGHGVRRKLLSAVTRIVMAELSYFHQIWVKLSRISRGFVFKYRSPHSGRKCHNYVSRGVPITISSEGHAGLSGEYSYHCPPHASVLCRPSIL